MSQNGPKTTSLMTSLTKNLQLTIKKFCFWVQTKSRRLADLFEPLNSSLARIGGGAMALVRQPKTAGIRLISKYKCITPRLWKC